MTTNEASTPVESVEQAEATALPADFLDPAEIDFQPTPSGVVRLVLGERVGYRRVIFLRLRPLTDPNHFIALWSSEKEEIGVIRDPGELSQENAAIVRAQLHRRYLTPVIQKIHRLRARFGVQEWQVRSSHGELRFYVRGLHQNIRRVPPSRLIITDVRGNRYDIPDVGQLDLRSFVQIQRHL